MGLIAKYTFGISIISLIENDGCIWIFTAALLGAFSRTYKTAMINVFAFFIAMMLSYYICTMLLFHFFPRQAVIYWSIITLITPICACIVWYSRGKGLLAAFFAALPVVIIIAKGCILFLDLQQIHVNTLGTEFTALLIRRAIVHSLDLAEAAVLFLVLPKGKKQYLQTFIFVAILSILYILNCEVLRLL